MPEYQRILVVTTTATDEELSRLRRDLGRDPLVLTAPTSEARRVVELVGTEPQVEALLAPVRFPQVDRGHRCDELVRRHALHDRYRDVVVVTDPATATLLLRVLAPDQLPDGGAVTLVGLARAARLGDVRRAVVLGILLGVAAGVAPSLGFTLALPAVVAGAGLALLLTASLRHVGRELLLAAGIIVVVGAVVIASAARFPAAW